MHPLSYKQKSSFSKDVFNQGKLFKSKIFLSLQNIRGQHIDYSYCSIKGKPKLRVFVFILLMLTIVPFRRLVTADFPDFWQKMTFQGKFVHNSLRVFIAFIIHLTGYLIQHMMAEIRVKTVNVSMKKHKMGKIMSKSKTDFDQET